MHDTLRTKATELECEFAESVIQYMSTEEGKRDILNPEGHTRILEGTFFSDLEIKDEIESRILLYIEKIFTDGAIGTKFKEIASMVFSFFQEICEDLEDYDGIKDLLLGETTLVKSAFTLRTLLWLPLYSMSFSKYPFYIFYNLLNWFLESKESRTDRIYNIYKETLYKKLKEGSCQILREIIEKVMVQLLPRRLDAFRERARQLQVEHHELAESHEFFNTLLKQVKSMNDRVKALQDCLNLNAFVAQKS